MFDEQLVACRRGACHAAVQAVAHADHRKPLYRQRPLGRRIGLRIDRQYRRGGSGCRSPHPERICRLVDFSRHYGVEFAVAALHDVADLTVLVHVDRLDYLVGFGVDHRDLVTVTDHDVFPVLDHVRVARAVDADRTVCGVDRRERIHSVRSDLQHADAGLVIGVARIIQYIELAGVDYLQIVDFR